MRRLPVYLVLDTSGSMRGEPIQAVNVGLQTMIGALRQDPYAIETLHVSIITFDAEVKTLLPLTPIDRLQLPEVTTPESGPTFLGKALQVLCKAVDRDVVKTTQERKGDWMPILFVMTDGSPSDLQVFRQQVEEVKKRPFATVVACAAGPKAKLEFLKQLTPNVLSLDTTDSSTFAQFFKYVSTLVGTGSRSFGATTEVELPPPPSEVRLVP